MLGEQTAERRGAERGEGRSACDRASLMGGTSDDSRDGERGMAKTRETRTLKPRISPGSYDFPVAAVTSQHKFSDL